MRPERLYLTDIVEAAAALERFITGVNRQAFMIDELRQSAVLQKLLVIGEAAARLDRGFRASHPGIPWSDIVAFRNFAVHAYFAVDWTIVWATVTIDVPVLASQVAAILESLHGAEE